MHFCCVYSLCLLFSEEDLKENAMIPILKLRLKRLGAFLLATGMMISAVGCSGGMGAGTSDNDNSYA